MNQEPYSEARDCVAHIVPTILVIAALLQGCAHVWVDPDGTRHVVGLVNLSLPPQSASKTAGESIRSKAIGLSFSASEAGSAFVFGYSDTTFAFVRNNSLVSADLLLRPKSSAFAACPKE